MATTTDGRTLICRLIGHKWGLFKAYRLSPSIVHQVRCQRCAALKGKP